jgi:hypothetical protein
MQKYAVCLGFLLLLSPCPATAGGYSLETIDDIRNACKKQELYEDGHRDTDSENTILALSCMDYMRGVYDTIIYYSKFLNDRTLCIPPETTYKQIRAIIPKWADQHPEQWHLHGLIGIFKSLKEVYSCSKQ